MGKRQERKPRTPNTEAAHADIYRLAVAQLGNLVAAANWLKTPKVTFKGRTPLEHMQTPAGCHDVKALLESLYD